MQTESDAMLPSKLDFSELGTRGQAGMQQVEDREEKEEKEREIKE